MAKIHLIGNAHLDPVWLWKWQEGFTEILATYRSALDRMNEFPDYKFTSACAAYYQWVEKVAPDMFEEIRRRVQEGRWCITGGWFIQPDCNTPCGESFARHGLLSQRYFREKFGVTAKTGYNVDSFGHNASLPKILRGCGMENYVFMRPMADELALDCDLFAWQSADGSRVNTYRLKKGYGIGALNDPEILYDVKAEAEAKNQDDMGFFGIGNHGGGPTIRLLDTITHMDIPDMFFSTPDIYFQTVPAESLPVRADELQHHARGCYSACTAVKMGNRRCENNLLAAEKLCSMGQHLADARYPAEKLRKAWKNVLFNQFHDIMGGCAIKSAYTDAGYLYGETMSITEQAMHYAMQCIGRRIDTLGGATLPAYKEYPNLHVWTHEFLGMPVVVFNPHSWPVRLPVQVSAAAVKVTDDRGNEIPFQTVRGEQNTADDRFNTVFTAQVGPMGYATYRLFVKQKSEAVFAPELSVTETSLENSRIRVEFSRATGDICRLYDKTTGKTVIDGECRALLLDESALDTWGHDAVYLGEECGTFGDAVFTVLESGPVRATLRVCTHCGESLLQRDYTISAGSEVVSVKVKTEISEKLRTLKFAFPAQEKTVVSKIPFGTVRRPAANGEEPCGSWVACGELCVANNGKHGYDSTGRELRLTVLRTTSYASAGTPTAALRDDFCEYMDMDVHECAYTVFPYTGSSAAERRAGELNFPPRTLLESFHAGDLPERYSCFACDSENVTVTAVKAAEDGSDTVIRLCEMDGRSGEVNFELFGEKFCVAIGHDQLRSFLVHQGKEVDLTEQ